MQKNNIRGETEKNTIMDEQQRNEQDQEKEQSLYTVSELQR